MALREMARSGEPALQQTALRDIAAHLAGERCLPVGLSAFEEVLGLLAAGGILQREVQYGAGPPVSWPVRREACRLLGELGSEGAWALLLQLLAAAPEAALRTEALGGLAGIGLDPQGELGRAILYTVAPRAGVGPEGERLLLAALEALRAALTGGFGHADDLRALAALAGGSYPQSVRTRASAHLLELAPRGE